MSSLAFAKEDASPQRRVLFQGFNQKRTLSDSRRRREAAGKGMKKGNMSLDGFLSDIFPAPYLIYSPAPDLAATNRAGFGILDYIPSAGFVGRIVVRRSAQEKQKT